LEHQASRILGRLEEEARRGQLIEEVNPRCLDDKLTDRWPASMQDQNLMIADLRAFIGAIRLLRSQTLDLAQMTAVLEGLFGQRPVRKAVDDYVAAMARNRGHQFVTPTGRVLAPAAGLVVPAAARPIAPHSFFGDP